MSCDVLTLNARYEREKEDVDTFVVVDIDRTLLNSDTLLDYFYRALRASYTEDDRLSEQEIETLRTEIAEQTGKQLDFLELIEARYGNRVDLEATIELLVANATDGMMHDILYDGAEALIDILEERPNAAVGLYTYGSQRTQEMKVRIIHAVSERLAMLPVAIESDAIDTKNKPQRADEEWRDDSGDFDIGFFDGYETAKSIIFIDDKDRKVEIVKGEKVVKGNLPEMNPEKPEFDRSLLGMWVDYKNGPGAVASLRNLAVFIASHRDEPLDVVALNWRQHHTVDNSANS